MLASRENVNVGQLPRGIVVFACPSCGNALRVPEGRAHESGPCPLCRTVISGPRPAPVPASGPGLVSRNVPAPARSAGDSAPVSRESRSFVAHKVIMPGPDVELDDSWKSRHENDLKAWRKRKEFEKKVSDFFQSRLWRRARLAGVVALMLILAGAVCFIYSEKKLGERSDGIFDGFKKADNPF